MSWWQALQSVGDMVGVAGIGDGATVGTTDGVGGEGGLEAAELQPATTRMTIPTTSNGHARGLLLNLFTVHTPLCTSMKRDGECHPAWAAG